jgi:hypothetical protein
MTGHEGGHFGSSQSVMGVSCLNPLECLRYPGGLISTLLITGAS